MSDILIIRQHTEGYDNLQDLKLSKDFDVIDLCGERDTLDYLNQQGYGFKELNNFTANRLVKFLPNLNYDFNVYLDSSLNLKSFLAFEELVKSIARNRSNLVLFNHPDRMSLLEEVSACYKLSKITKSQYRTLIKSKEVLHCKSKLSQNGFLIIRATNEMSKWGIEFFEFLNRSKIGRDQIMLPLFLQKNTPHNTYYYDWPEFVEVKPHNTTLRQKVIKKLNYLKREYLD